MTSAADTRQLWRWSWIRQHYIRFFFIVIHLLLRTMYGIFWLFAAVHKINSGWLTSSVMEEIFLQRLGELHPDSFSTFYLEAFAIPFYPLVAWGVTIVELYVGLALMLGVTVRLAAVVSFFVLLNFAIGGYYDASLIVFFLLAVLFASYSSGHWLGLDARLYYRCSQSIWFR